MAIKIVSDSTADIPSDLAERLGITVVPAYVLIDDVAYREGVDITREDFYVRLQASPRLPTTSQPTVLDFTQHLEPLVNSGDQVVCITVSKQLSGTYNSAIQAAAALPDGAVSVIDSNTATAGHMLQVVAAAEDAAAEDATVESVLSAANLRASRSFTYCALDTLEYLQKGGRIGKAQAFMGSILKVKPILKVSGGEVLPIDRPRNTRRAMQRLEDWCEATARPPNWQLRILRIRNSPRHCGPDSAIWCQPIRVIKCRLGLPSGRTADRAPLAWQRCCNRNGGSSRCENRRYAGSVSTLGTGAPGSNKRNGLI